MNNHPSNKHMLYLAALVLGLSILVGSCKKDDDDNGVIDHSQKEWLNQNLTYGTVTDRDGNSYATIKIGNQEWMAENLRTSRYCNGDAIPNITDNFEWAYLTTGAWSVYDNESENIIPHGYLYNWYAVDDERNICPCGWHVPSDEEWKTLTDYLGGRTGAGTVLKTTTGWIDHNDEDGNGTNESGFSATPSGLRKPFGAYNRFGITASWWSSTGNVGIFDMSWNRFLSNISDDIGRWTMEKEFGLSVRCVINK